MGHDHVPGRGERLGLVGAPCNSTNRKGDAERSQIRLSTSVPDLLPATPSLRPRADSHRARPPAP